MKTPEEIDKQIEALKAIRPKVRPFSAFGDDNLAKIDAQIQVLEEDMDYDDIWDEWPDEEGDVGIRMVADDVVAWMIDEGDIKDLAENWPLTE